MQTRQKWHKDVYNYKIGDLVLLTDTTTHRNQWPLARIIEVFPDKVGTVRVAKVVVAKYKNSKTTSDFGLTELVRPIAKLILLKTNY